MLMERINAQVESHEKYSSSFVKILAELDSNKTLLGNISSNSKRDHETFVNFVRTNERIQDENKEIFEIVLSLIREEVKKSEKSKSLIDQLSMQIQEIYAGRVGSKNVLKHTVFYIGAVFTVLAIIEALIQFGILHLVWGGH